MPKRPREETTETAHVVDLTTQSDKSDKSDNRLYLVGCESLPNPDGAYHLTINKKGKTIEMAEIDIILGYIWKWSAQDCFAYCIEKNKDGSTHMHYAGILKGKQPQNWRAQLRKLLGWDKDIAQAQSKMINFKSKYTPDYTWRNVIGGYMQKSETLHMKGIHPEFIRKGKVVYDDLVAIKKAKFNLSTYNFFPTIIRVAKNNNIKSFTETIEHMVNKEGIPIHNIDGKYTQFQLDEMERHFDRLINNSTRMFSMNDLQRRATM